MREIGFALFATLLMVAFVFVVGEIGWRIEYAFKRRAIRKQIKADEARAPIYTVLDAHFVMLLQTKDAHAALQRSIGLQGASVWKNDEKILQNRTLVQAGGK